MVYIYFLTRKIYICCLVFSLFVKVSTREVFSSSKLYYVSDLQAKNKLTVPAKSYPEGYEAPLVLFFSDIFHPFIDPETKILNLSTKVKQLRGVSSLVCLLNYLKSIFYSKYLNEENVANPKAMELYKKDHLAYAKRAKQVVAKSLKEQYENDTESSLKFSKYVPEYEKVRKLILGKSHS